MKKLIAVILMALTLTGVFASVASAEKKNVKAAKATALSMEEANEFHGAVKIKMVTKKAALRYGKEITLKAVVKGAKKGSYDLQWEVRTEQDGAFTAIENETGKTFSFTLTQENASCEYRVAVIAK